MAFDRKTWLNWHDRKPCPACKTGKLLTSDDRTLSFETESSRNEEYSQYFSDYRFSAILTCSNCNEIVTATGAWSKEYDHKNDKEITNIYPQTFFPAPPIISIPPSCPSTVTYLLIDSFSLYWVDESSCANKIRTAIEALLNELKVKKTILTRNRKRKKISLHKRIEELNNTNETVGKFLLAIKWIGNAGSHLSNMTKEDLLDAYELLEYSLELLFPDKKKKLTKISSEINRRRKPRKK